MYGFSCIPFYFINGGDYRCTGVRVTFEPCRPADTVFALPTNEEIIIRVKLDPTRVFLSNDVYWACGYLGPCSRKCG